MRRALLVVVLMTMSVCWAESVQIDLVVIVNANNPINALTREQVVDIYMGRRTHFPNGQAALPIDLSPDSPLRVAFYQILVGRTVAQVNAYWARLLFTGRATPPRVLPTPEAVRDVVRANPNAIAYLNRQMVDDQVKIVYHLR